MKLITLFIHLITVTTNYFHTSHIHRTGWIDEVSKRRLRNKLAVEIFLYEYGTEHSDIVLNEFKQDAEDTADFVLQVIDQYFAERN